MNYNKDRGLPEPKLGWLMSEVDPDHPLQCPACGSHEIYASAHPDDPEEILRYEAVRCGNCGRITDWYEAFQAYQLHYTEQPRSVTGKP